MYTIAKEFSFSASHRLDRLPTTHPCHTVHGHNYTVRFVLQTRELDSRGFVLDYHELNVVKQYIDTHMDHRDLNSALPCYPTAENLAYHLFQQFDGSLQHLVAVQVCETPSTMARYSPDSQVEVP